MVIARSGYWYGTQAWGNVSTFRSAYDLPCALLRNSCGTRFAKALIAWVDYSNTVMHIAPAAVFLASFDSKYITGETLLISGGLK
jgi:NAD(P)-dependent dehydrogenase (short-subunit alcohol dehydrogenase family)